MDNVNTDELNENTNENDWVVINRVTELFKDTETAQLPKVQENLANQIDPDIQKSNNGVEVIHEHIDSDNTSNDVSIITESDTDNPYQNFFTTHQDNKIYVCGSKDMVNRINRQYHVQNNITKCDTDVFNKNFLLTSLDHDMYRSKDMVDEIILQNYEFDNNAKILNMITCIVLGCVIGIFCGHFLATDNMNLHRNELKDFQIECHNIVNIFKEINTTLNKIKSHVLIENKFNKDRAWQPLESWKLLENINFSNKKDKYMKESLNNDPYILDNLQVSLNVLSLLTSAIYDNNSLLKSEMNKTLDIINTTKILYETLLSFNNNTQNTNISVIVQFLRNAIDKIHHTSRSFLTDLVKKISNVMLNVHDKYSKMKDKLNEKLCHLKNVLPDDNEFLKQLTMKSQSLNEYYKYCHSKNGKKKRETNREQNTRTNNVKKQTKKTDDSMSHIKFEKKNTQTIDTETCRDKVINDYSQSTKTADQCIDETLNINFDEATSKQNTKTTSDYGKITADKTKVNGPKSNNHFKLDSSTRKYSTDKLIEKNVSPQIKKRKYVPKSDKGYYRHTFKNYPTEQDNHQTKSADWLFERSNAREKLRQASNVNFSKVLKTSNPKVKNGENIHDMMQKFGEIIDETMHLFGKKIEQVLKKQFFSKKN